MTDATVIRVGGVDAYDVIVGRGILSTLPDVLGPRVAKVLIVHPPTLGAKANALRESLLDRFEVLLAEVPDAEDAKRVEVAAFCWQIMGQTDFTRSDAVVGLGGGATTDLAGFVAATWLRGVDLIQLPTTVLGMVDAAFEHTDDFYVLDDLNEQKLYNCARNIEIAIWKMSSTRAGNGEPLLFSNELDPNNPNTSFEREFGRVIGLLELLAKVVADKHGRSVTRFTQSLATAVFLPVSALGIK